jgi:hypothetical protein
MALILKKNIFLSTVILHTVNEDPAMVKFLLDAGVNYQVGGSSGTWVNHQVFGSSGFLGQLTGRWVAWVPGVNCQVGGSSGFLGQLSGRWIVWVPGSTIV